MSDFWSIILPVPEVERLVDRFRREGDWSREHGVPAHMTLAGPWPGTVSAPLGVLSGLAAGLAGARYELGSLGRLGDAVCLFVADEAPLTRWRDLALAAVGAPDRTSADWRLHLTIRRHSSGAEGLAEVSRAIAPALPIACTARSALIARRSASGEVTLGELSRGGTA